MGYLSANYTFIAQIKGKSFSHCRMGEFALVSCFRAYARKPFDKKKRKKKEPLLSAREGHSAANIWSGDYGA